MKINKQFFDFWLQMENVKIQIQRWAQFTDIHSEKKLKNKQIMMEKNIMLGIG